MTQKPRGHLELSRTCRNDVGTSIIAIATTWRVSVIVWSFKINWLCVEILQIFLYFPLNMTFSNASLFFVEIFGFSDNFHNKHIFFSIHHVFLWNFSVLPIFSTINMICLGYLDHTSETIETKSKSIRPNKYPSNSQVGPRRNILHKNQGDISSFLEPVEMT